LKLMRGDEPLPWQARGLDAVAAGALLLALSVCVSGGFREWTPLGRLSVTSAWRPALAGLVALLFRHWWWRRPSFVARVLEFVQRRLLSVDARIVWPMVAATRLGVLVVGFLGIVLLGYAPNTPPYRIYNNDFLDMPARWDTGWYLGIATHGYEFDPAKIDGQQNIAFFPVYPMLMRYGSIFAGRQVLWTGVAVSLIAFFAALVYLLKLARRYIDDDAAAIGVALLASYPFAFFFSTAYTESLFLLTAVAACYHFERDELWQASAWGLVAGLTRPNGCLLSIVLALLVVSGRGVRSWRELPAWRLAARAAAAAAPGIGMLVYSAFIYELTGNPLQWAVQNAAWGRVYRGVDLLVGDQFEALQQNGLYGYASTQPLDLINGVALFFALASVWPVYRRMGVPYAAMVLLTVLPPLTMGGLLSMGRITSVIFPLFLWLGTAVPPRHRTAWLMGFAMLQGLGAIVFFTWRPLY
jgi:hypothetical protein